jgi:demethylmenaquinone methyltransferase/2-methoxy-6-polyprenyl-1,4-benzoquinol methylase
VFFGFWLSHVPPAKVAWFWEFVGAAPGRRGGVRRRGPGERALEEFLAGRPAPAVRRRLNDGTGHRVVKLFPDPDGLTAELGALGWTALTHATFTRAGHYGGRHALHRAFAACPLTGGAIASTNAAGTPAGWMVAAR